MTRFLFNLSTVVLCVTSVSFGAHAQVQDTVSSSVQLAATTGGRQTTAVRAKVAPVVDGNVLDDEAWSSVSPATGFVQTAPDEGEPASERTEVRVVFTDDTIYLGVVCYDRDPASIIVTDSRRDSSLSDSDSFQFVIDTFLDRQNGFVFGTSPSAHEYDGQLVNEGQGRGNSGFGGQTRGAGGGFNLNWDGVWQVRTDVSDIGWSAEFAIPFRTIRFPPGQTQTWGVNFQRTIRRRNESAFWAPLPRQFDLFRVSMAGQLTGVEAPEVLWRTLQLTPYVVGEAFRSTDTPDRGVRTLGDIGGDLKYGVTSGLTLDLTYNTDFAQAEVDDQQINLDRFNLFFPEKRSFFLENAGAFTVSNNSVRAGFNDTSQTELFFSRRIGIGSEGQAISILGGARLSGKVSNSVTVGFLNMQTESVGDTTPANNFTVARVRQDLPNRSGVGGLFVNRQATGSSQGRTTTTGPMRSMVDWGLARMAPSRGSLRRRRPRAAATRTMRMTWPSTTTPRPGSCVAAIWSWGGTSTRRWGSCAGPGSASWTPVCSIPGGRMTFSRRRSFDRTSRSRVSGTWMTVSSSHHGSIWTTAGNSTIAPGCSPRGTSGRKAWRTSFRSRGFLCPRVPTTGTSSA